MNDEVVVRDGPKSYLRLIAQRMYSSGPDATGALVRSQPGILIFSRKQQLLHVNRRTLELIGHLDQSEIGPVNDIPLASLQELRIVIQKTLDHRKEANIWEPFELSGVTFDAGRKILIRGFGIADRDSYDDSLIVILVENVGLRQKHKIQQTMTRDLSL